MRRASAREGRRHPAAAGPDDRRPLGRHHRPERRVPAHSGQRSATTYPFPVRFKVVEGADIPRLLAGDRALLDPSLAAARDLVNDGCRAIVGACGYFAKFQREMAEALEVPVFMSSLCQVPMILGSLRSSEQLGIVCASKPSLDAATLAAAPACPPTRGSWSPA
jgi:hypothetical protein